MDTTDELIGAIYEASQEPEGWTDVVKRLGLVLGSRKVALFSCPSPGAPPTLFCDDGYDPAERAAYIRDFAPHDEWTKASERMRIPSGLPVTSEEMVSLEQLKKTLFYADWLRPWGSLHGCGVRFVNQHSFSVVNAIRGPHDGPFDADALAIYLRLCPHLGRSFSIARRLDTLTTRNQALSSALDRLSHAVLVVDARGRITEANEAARVLLERRDGLGVARHDALAAADHNDNEALTRLIKRAATLTVGGVMPVKRKTEGRQPYHVLVAPAMGRLAARSGIALVFISDMDRQAKAPEETLATLFGLTKAEGQVLASLAQGNSPDEVAADLGLSVHTVRSHIKAIHAKTNCRRTSDLIRMVADSPASWVASRENTS